MRIRLATWAPTAAFALLFGAAITTNASAQAGAATRCKDGTTSTVSGKGACSGHGGVDTKAAKSMKAADKSAAKIAKTDAKADAKAAKTEAKADTKIAKTDAKAAAKDAKTDAKQVKCTDGTMSKGGRGACSHHGGIAKPGK